MRSSLAAAVIAALAATALGDVPYVRALGAQSRPAGTDRSSTGETAAEERLAFEAATIRRAAPNAVRNRVMPSGPGRLVIPSMSLTWLIYTAYADGMGTSARVSGGPDWVNQDAYEVQAVSPSNPTPRELRLMLQTLLEERFAMRLRRETPTIDVLALVPDRSDGTLGPNVKTWDGTCGAGASPVEDDPFRPRCPSGWLAGRGLMLEGATMFAAAEALSLPMPRAELGRLVHDGTGFDGRYNFRLDYRFPPPARPGEPAAAPIGGPSLSTAVREQWGLRLEPAKGPFLGLVVESVERPTGN
jgi:uncharacterized protein (TIGR03435 family)